MITLTILTFFLVIPILCIKQSKYYYFPFLNKDKDIERISNLPVVTQLVNKTKKIEIILDS